MSIVYLVALAAVVVVFFGVFLDAVISVSRKPVWPHSDHKLSLVETVDRREQQLPFVGQERRQERRQDEPEADHEAQALSRVA